MANAGVLTFDASGNYIFDPAPAFTGTISVPYSICDNGSPSACDTAILVITVNPLPAVTNSVIANNDEKYRLWVTGRGNVMVNDADPQGDAFTVTAVTGSTPGTGFTVAGTDANETPWSMQVRWSLMQTVRTHIPGFGIHGIYRSAFYTITDAQGATATAVLHIDVLTNVNLASNDAPFAGDDFSYTTVDQPVTGSFINNDSDPNNDPGQLWRRYNRRIGPLPHRSDPIDHRSRRNAPVICQWNLSVPRHSAGYAGPDFITYTICDVTTVPLPSAPARYDASFMLIGPAFEYPSGQVWDVPMASADAGITEPKRMPAEPCMLTW